jgi:hypothetical protein
MRQFKRLIQVGGAAVSMLCGASAFALAPCSAITNLAQLVQAGTCYTGPNNSVTFSNFVTNATPSQQTQMAVATTAGGYLGGTGTTALLGFIVDVSAISMPNISISFSAQCDASCKFNDGFNRINGDPGTGSGQFYVNGQSYAAVPQGYAQPQFNPYVSSVNEYVAYTQTSGTPGETFNFEMDVNIVPTGYASSGLSPMCPKQ